jgi:hypothetical protein
MRLSCAVGAVPAGAMATGVEGVPGAARPHQQAAALSPDAGGGRGRPHRLAIELGAAVQLCAAAHRGHSTALDHV